MRCERSWKWLRPRGNSLVRRVPIRDHRKADQKTMGVNVYILDRYPVRLSVAGIGQDVGSLRRSWKITEMDDERADELSKFEAAASAVPSPAAAMLADVEERPLASASGVTVRAHLVIGWDEGRTRVMDTGWDYLPILGYGVRDPDAEVFMLYEERDCALHHLDRERAFALGLIGPDGLLAKHGQPTISECHSVQSYIAGYAEADCKFDDGRQQKLLIDVVGNALPDPSWLIGKKPMQVGQYVPARPAADTTLAGKRAEPTELQLPDCGPTTSRESRGPCGVAEGRGRR